MLTRFSRRDHSQKYSRGSFVRLLSVSALTLSSLLISGLGCSITHECTPVVDSVEDDIIHLEWEASELSILEVSALPRGKLSEGLPMWGALQACHRERHQNIQLLQERLGESQEALREREALAVMGL